MAKNMELNIVMSAAVAGALTGMAQVANAMKNTAKSAEELGKKAKELEKAQRALEKVEKLKSAYVNVSKEYLNAARKLHELKEAYNKTGQSNTELAKKIKEQEKVVNSLNKQKERQKHVFEAARSAIEGENQSLGSYKSQLTKVNSELEKMNKLKEAQKRYEVRQENIGKVKEFGDRTFNRGMATAGALAVPMKVYMDVEESQADLRKMLGDEAKKYYADIRKISENSPLSQPELYEIAGSLAQSGIVGDQIVEYTNKAQQLKVAFDMSTQASGEFLAKTKEQLGLTKEQVFAFADTINYMADNTASSAAQLVDFSNRVGGVAKTMGIAKEANIAFGATLISMGKQPEVAATGIKQLYLELGKGADTKRKASAFEFLGLNGDQVAQDMAKDAEGTILKVLEKIKGLSTADKAGVLNDLFGEQAIDSIATLSNQTDKLRENLVKAKSEMANGAVEKEYKNRMDTLANSLKLAKNQMMNALADLGLALAPTIKSALEALTPMIKKVAEWIRQNPKLASGIMKAVAGFALLSLGVGGAIKVFSPLFSTISKGILIFDKFKIAGNFTSGLKTAFPIINKLGPAMMKLGPLLSNPYVLAGAVIVGVFVLLYAKWKWFRDGVNNGIKQIAPYFKAVADTLKNAFGQLSSSATKELGKMKPLFDSLKPVLSVIGNVIKFVIIGALMEMNVRIKVLVAIFKVAFTAIRVVVMVVFNVIKAIVIGAVAVIKGVVKTLAFVFKAVWTVIKVVAIAVWAAICIAIITVVGVIKAMFRPFAPFFKAIWSAIKVVAIAVWNAIKAKATALWGGLKSGISGVKNFFSPAWETMKTVATNVWNAIKSAFDTVAGGLKKAIDGVVNYFTEKWNKIKDFAANNPISAGIGGLFGKNAAGTNYWQGGLTTVAERGAELIQIPGKPAFLAESEMLLNLPKGTRILNNSQTRSTLRDKVANLRDRVSNLKSGNSYGGNNYSITINVNGGNPSEVERIVRKVIAGDINKRERTAFG
ncbi:MAG: phage tail tape measure protein [Leptotrichia hongkongensis]